MVLGKLIDFILHVDTYLSAIIQNYGVATYLILFLVIFCETGLVITPFLPGDSLIFAAGTFAASGMLNVFLLFVILVGAAIIGDSVNYAIGKYFGEQLFLKSRLIKQEHLDRTKGFYERHGGKTIIMARFVPIVRTFAPFVAGIGKMNYWKFFSYNVIGGLLWVAIFLFGGFYLGGLEFVKHNLTYVIFGIIFVSILPPIIEYFRMRKK